MSGKVTFEMILALAGDNALEALKADPELSRHTAVGVLASADGDLLCLWAGAKQREWDAGDGATLQTCVREFALAS